MPAPSQLSIATSVLNRLIKEEVSYRKEFDSQQARIAQLETEQSNDENAEYTLRQERKALDETRAMFPTLRTKIEEAKTKLETQLDKGPSDPGSADEVTKAKEAVAAALTAIRETS